MATDMQTNPQGTPAPAPSPAPSTGEGTTFTIRATDGGMWVVLEPDGVTEAARFDTRGAAEMDAQRRTSALEQEEQAQEERNRSLLGDAPEAPAKALGGAVKALTTDGTGGYLVRGKGIYYGGRDLTGDRFTPGTDIGRDRSFIGMPLYYDHAKTGLKSQIGKVVAVEEDEAGIDFVSEIDRAHKYAGEVVKLIESGALGYSTGALPHLVIRRQGNLKRWIVGELSLTPTPAEPRTVGVRATKGLDTMEETQKIPDVAEMQRQIGEQNDKIKSLQGQLDAIKSLPAVQRGANGKPIALPNAPGIGYNPGQLQAGALAAPDYRNMKAVSYRGRAVMREEYPEDSLGGFAKALWNSSDPNPAIKDRAAKALGNVYGAAFDEEATKALGTDSGVSGAYLVPEQFIPQLMQVAAANDIIYPRATIIPSEGGEMIIPSLDMGGTYVEGQSQYFAGTTVAWGDDDSEPPLTQPQFRQTRLKTNSLMARVRVKNSLMMRSAISIDAVITQLLGGAVGRARDYAFHRGTGVGQPLGVINAPATITAGGTTFNFSAVQAMAKRRIPERMMNYIWVAHIMLFDTFLALQTTNNTLVSWLPNLRDPVPGMLLGLPIYFTDKLPYASGDHSGSVILIDPSAYVVSEFQGIALAVSDQARFEQAETVFRVIGSLDGKPWINAPINVGAAAGESVSYFTKLG